jgi:hypothetical protein
MAQLFWLGAVDFGCGYPSTPDGHPGPAQHRLPRPGTAARERTYAASQGKRLSKTWNAVL